MGSTTNTREVSSRGVVLGLFCIVLLGCPSKNEFAAPPPPEVTVENPDQEEVTEYAEFVGRVRAQRVVEVRAQVSGFLHEVDYKPGVVLEKQTTLFRLQPEPFDLAVASNQNEVKRAEASLTRAEADAVAARARLKLAETAVKKLEAAYATRAVSEIQVLETRAQRDVSRAAVKQADAEVEVAKEEIGIAKGKLARAELERRWADVKAPIRGRAAFRKVEEGDLIDSSKLLTTIVDDDDVFIDFDVPEVSVQRMRKRDGEDDISKLVVEARLPTDEGFPHKGRGEYVAPEVDTSTGTLRIRARLKNADRKLLPGSFVRVRIPVRTLPKALLVPRRALKSDQVGEFLLVVDEEGTVKRRDVKVSFDVGTRVVIASGLEEADRVIVDGLQRARPGAKVDAQRAKKKSE